MTITQTKSEDRKPYPLRFVEAQEQEDAAAFCARVPGFSFFFNKQRLFITQLNAGQGDSIPKKDSIVGVTLEISFVDANADVRIEGFDEAPGKIHYFTGKDPSQWKTGLSSFKKLRYTGIWAGVDLEVGSCDEGLKLNWILDTPERVGAIRLRWSGADALELDEQGDLEVHHALGVLTDAAPLAWQVIDGQEKPVSCAYRLDGDEVSFELGDTDPDYPVVIDPIIGYATYLGGSEIDYAVGIAVDSTGCAYVTGSTLSSNFPTTPGAFQETSLSFPAYAAFVTKLSADGTEALFSTYLSGSSGQTVAGGIDVDTADCAYAVGSTYASDFPVTPGAFQTTFAGSNAGFVTKLAPDGASLVYSTFLSGTANSVGVGAIAVDDQGFAYVTGITTTNFPTTAGAFQETFGGGSYDALMTKFNQDGTALVFSTYLGGSETDSGSAIRVNEDGRVYACGSTMSTDFPVTPGAFQDTLVGGYRNGFITALASDGASLVFSTFLGAAGGGPTRSSSCLGIALEPSGVVAVCGDTNADDFPTTPGAYLTTLPSGGGFVSRLTPDGAQLLASTYLGGRVYSIAVDAQGYVYCSGYRNVINTVVWLLNAGLTRLLAEAAWGQTGNTGTNSCLALGPGGSYYIAGSNDGGPGFTPTPGAFQTTYGGGVYDAFVARSGFVVVSRASMVITGIF